MTGRILATGKGWLAEQPDGDGGRIYVWETEPDDLGRPRKLRNVVHVIPEHLDLAMAALHEAQDRLVFGDPEEFR